MQEKIAIRKQALINRKHKYFEVSSIFFKPLFELINKEIKNKKIFLSLYYPINYEVNALKLFNFDTLVDKYLNSFYQDVLYG